jgi:hypothetical protein
MEITLSPDEAQLVVDVLRQRLADLDKEVSRTDSRAFKKELQKLERATERVLGEIAMAVDQATSTTH